jgi:hypothetical protein
MKITATTAKGLTVETTHTRHGCLEQGGICGRIEHFAWATVAQLGITPANAATALDDGAEYNDCLSVGAWRRHMLGQLKPDRLLARGQIIR